MVMQKNVKVHMCAEQGKKIHNAAKALVDLKFEIDTKGRTSPLDIPDDLHGSYSGGEFGGPLGYSFLCRIIPFLQFLEPSPEPATVMDVPTLQTIGRSWRIWPDPDISHEEKNRILERLRSDTEINQTRYTHIPELHLFAASEGQNRVNFFRFHNIECIPAIVRVEHYPAADRIKIYVEAIAGGQDVWAVLDERYVQKVSHFAYVLPLLRAYGVDIFYEWPPLLPSSNELLEYAQDMNPMDFTFSIDLIALQNKKQKIKNIIDRNEEYVSCSYIKLDTPYSSSFFIKIHLIFIFSFVLLMCIVLGSTNDVVENISITLLAFLSGICVCAIAPIIKCKRKNLRP